MFNTENCAIAALFSSERLVEEFIGVRDCGLCQSGHFTFRASRYTRQQCIAECIIHSIVWKKERISERDGSQRMIKTILTSEA